MDRITASNVFITIVEQGSMTKASATLGMSRSMVTRYLSEMEDWVGARLLHRSTRKLSLTNAGEQALVESYKLQSIDEELRYTAASVSEEPGGVIRIGCSQFFGEYVLAPFVAAYLARYKRVSVDIQISNHSVNLVEERVDLAIRITNNLDPNLIARKFGTLQSVLCASPDYLREKAALTELSQLGKHNCLTYAYFVNHVWSFVNDGELKTIGVSGSLSANDPAVLLNATLQGSGISMLPRFSAKPYLDTGQLLEILPSCEPQTLGIYGIYRSRKHMPKALRLFIDELAVYTETLDL